MSDEISIKEPEWRDTPDYCPRCDRDLERDLDDGGQSGWKVGYRDGSSDHGEYSEAYCLSCKFPLQRHYETAEVSQQEDPLVAPEPWAYTAEILEQDTTLKHREAQVKALKKQGCTHAEIADTLGISESTVGEYSRRISNRIEESIRTLEEIGVEVDPLRHIEAQFEGRIVMPTSGWTCGVCNTPLEPGIDAQVVSEFVGDVWKTVELFCDECEPEPYPEWDETAQETLTTYAIVKGELDRIGDAYVPNPTAPTSADSLMLRDVTVAQIIN